MKFECAGFELFHNVNEFMEVREVFPLTKFLSKMSASYPSVDEESAREGIADVHIYPYLRARILGGVLHEN